MGISIGRVGLDIDGLQTPLGAGGYVRQGDVLRLQGRMRASTLEDGLWLREQLLGLLGNADEPWVRLTWDDALNVNGLYVVEDVSVDSFELTLTTGGSPYSATLRRVPSFAFPQFETQYTWGGPIANGHSATATRAAAAIPNTATAFGTVSGTSWTRQASTSDRAVSTGATMSVVAATGSASTAYLSTAAWSAPLDNIYDGAARIEITAGTSSAYRTLIGRQAPDGYAAGWRLTNDLIRVTPSSGKIAVSVWDGAAWTTAKEYTLSDTVGIGAVNGFSGMTVLRNSPDQVVVRLWCTTTLPSNAVTTLDLAVSRGTRFVAGAIAGTSTIWQIERTTGEAGANLADVTPVTVGLRASANDAQGDRYVLVSDYGTVITAGSGRLTLGAGRTVMRFMCGLEVNGSGAVGYNTASSMAAEWLCGVSTTTVVRSR